MMDARQQRGLVIAATCKIVPAQRGAYYVPSQSKAGSRYRVEPDFPRCDCPDFQAMGMTCKHLFAVAFTVERDTSLADGAGAPGSTAAGDNRAGLPDADKERGRRD